MARNSALLRHIRASEEEAAGEMLAQGADANATDHQGTPALVVAAGNPAMRGIVGLLLEKGAAVNAEDGEGTTALMAAADHHGVEACELLIAHHAAIDSRDAHGNTALLRAAASADNFLEERFHLLRLLLDKGADPNAKNDSGVTALMLAAARASSPALQILLDRGAEVNARDRIGRTALTIAVRQGDADPVQLLLEHKADPNARDQAGRSVLLASIDAPDHFSYQNQEMYSFAVFQLLIENGARVNVADNEGITPLLVAVQRGYWEAVRLLVERGADVTARARDLAAGTPVEELLHKATAGKP
jgi:ankyrin repeat protein